MLRTPVQYSALNCASLLRLYNITMKKLSRLFIRYVEVTTVSICSNNEKNFKHSPNYPPPPPPPGWLVHGLSSYVFQKLYVMLDMELNIVFECFSSGAMTHSVVA